MEIAFGILSAKEPEDAVKQLVRSLGTDDPVFVHHDYSKQARFTLEGTPAYLIPDYVETNWGSAGLPRAIFHLIRTALQRSSFDYFQLLSASCLPLRPVDELRCHLAREQKAIHADVLYLDRDERAMMSHGHRVFCRAEKMAYRLLRRSRRWYMGDEPVTYQQANLGIHDRPDPEAQLTALQWLGKQVHHAARVGLLDNHPFHGDKEPLVGSLWFCLRRDVCEYLVEQEHSSYLVPYLLSLKVCDEILFPTLLGNSTFEIVPSNHLVNEFIGAHPRVFRREDLQALAGSVKFFARKFSTRVSDDVRQDVIRQVESRKRPRPSNGIAGSHPSVTASA
jgi:hypothetical protein